MSLEIGVRLVILDAGLYQIKLIGPGIIDTILGIGMFLQLSEAKWALWATGGELGG